MFLNTTYRDARVGTGTFTRNLIDALPEARHIRLPNSMIRANRYAFWSRRLLELGASFSPRPVIHPYWTASAGHQHLIAPLDLFQFNEATPFERRLMKRSAGGAGALLALSEATARDFRNLFEVPVFVTRPLPEAMWFEPASETPKLHGRLRLAYWGGDHPRKQVGRFLASLSRTRFRDAELHHTGKIVDTFGVKCVGHGPLSATAVRNMVDSCHAAVYPSSGEGFGLPVYESLLRSRAVLASPLPVYAEFAPGEAVIHVADWDDPRLVEQAIADAVAPSRSAIESLEVSTRDAALMRLRGALLTAIDGCTL